ncbi:transcriptional regulator, TetR family [Renibacterium salmoninarum ATCC 33209]|uniref:Transcriptional regulator, TetR family n=1 Tax=Renibacterium salmoninarum (strain ATCC 33209 / DSM 20767 / JCM 11484 / NBRC 15589 / NCIMB 2235) TaxID=288705 RepID=A9WR82_RENSM|nr:TetR/AcrR family transcriptional regulator [Renibacterium salmoninarum]ABY24091.1 transcriptional regulator, TetR family [Renibacterium salmoninarum ATCC 33209]
MPIPPGESIDPERARQRIIEVCDSVFASRGIHLAGMNEIAVATKSSKASIYKNFGSKEGLVEAVLDHRSRQPPGATVDQVSRGTSPAGYCANPGDL